MSFSIFVLLTIDLISLCYKIRLSHLFFFAVMTTSTPEKTDGLKALNSAIEKIQETIKTMGGIFTMQMAVSTMIFLSDVIFFLSVFNQYI